MLGSGISRTRCRWHIVRSSTGLPGADDHSPLSTQFLLATAAIEGDPSASPLYAELTGSIPVVGAFLEAFGRNVNRLL
jgi:hypothetical protein